MSRAEVLSIWPETDPNDVMTVDEADEYILLWDAAAKMSAANSENNSRNWLRLMDACWRGDLARGGLLLFYGDPPFDRKYLSLGACSRRTARRSLQNRYKRSEAGAQRCI